MSMDSLGPRLAGRTALITGGARGIGAATSRLLAEHGASVVIADLDGERARIFVDELEGMGLKARAKEFDASSEAAWKETTEEILRIEGRLDVVVNNAGIGFFGTVEDVTLEQWEKTQAVNHTGVFLGNKYSIIAMKKAGNGGSIINMSSVKGLVGSPEYACYDASKGGVRALTKASALHCAKQNYGIRVNSIHPGYVNTDAGQSTGFRSAEDVRQMMDAAIALHPIGRIADPLEIAFPILFLASDESSFMTGSELVVDGGYTAQ